MAWLEELAKGGVEGILSPIAKVIQIFKPDATQQAQLDAAFEQAKLNAEATILTAINATMQAEAKSEHWMQWSWRPVIGFTFAATILNNYVLYGYFSKLGMVQIIIPEGVWMAMLAVLGVSAYVRGRDKNGNGK